MYMYISYDIIQLYDLISFENHKKMYTLGTNIKSYHNHKSSGPHGQSFTLDWCLGIPTIQHFSVLLAIYV